MSKDLEESLAFFSIFQPHEKIDNNVFEKSVFRWADELSEIKNHSLFNSRNFSFDQTSESITKIFNSYVYESFNNIDKDKIHWLIGDLFHLIDKVSENRTINENYSRILSSYLIVKNTLLDHKYNSNNVYLNSLEDEFYNGNIEKFNYENLILPIVFDFLEFRIDKYRQIALFNSVPNNKFDIKGLNIKLAALQKKNNQSQELLHFYQLWSVTKEKMIDELNYFIEYNPEFGLYFENNHYYYDDNQSHAGVKMAGFLVALNQMGWIKLFHTKSNRSLYDAKSLVRVINEFFNCSLKEKGEPFQKSNLENLRDPSSLYPTRVEPFLKSKSIRKNNF